MPFVVVGLLGLSILPFAWDGTPLQAVLLVLVTALWVALTWIGTGPARYTRLAVLAPMVLFVAIALGRAAGSSVASSALGPLVTLPILWAAIHGTRRHLVVTAVGTAAVFWLPAAMLGPPSYPAGDYWRGLITFAFAVLVGPMVQRLVRSLAEERARSQRSEARLEGLLDHLPDTAVGLVHADDSVTEVAGSQWLRARFEERGWARHERMFAKLVVIAREEGEAHTTFTDDETGKVLEIEVVRLPPRPDELGSDVLVAIYDVTEERERERHLRSAMEREERLLEDAPQGVVLLDRTGVVARANTSFLAMTGMSAEQVVGRSIADLSSDPVMSAHLAGLQPGVMDDADTTLQHVDGHDVDVHVSSRLLETPQGGETAILMHVVDISDRLRIERRLAHLADHDPLTDLANRRAFEAALLRVTDPRPEDRGAIVLVDLDHFKQVNDSLGHAAGDLLLVAVARLLRRDLRTADTVARIGGDEFAILLPEATLVEAEQVAVRMIDRIRSYTHARGGAFGQVGASAGVVLIEDALVHSADPLVLADAALYDAKRQGRNRAVVAGRGEQAVDQVRPDGPEQWHPRLLAALETQSFELHLQPIIDLRTDRAVGAEALVRMREGDELILPRKFVDVAETTGLVVELDQVVARLGIAVLADLLEVWPDFRLQVNVSAKSFGLPAFEKALVRTLAEHQVDGSHVVLEITESTQLRNFRAARAFGERMATLGCRIALDDFGAGWGSFYYLKHLPIAYLKIEGEFVTDALSSELDRKLVRSVVRLASDLGAQTIAEYVSSDEALALVREEGVDFAQGFLLGEPVPVPEFLERFGPKVRS